MSGFAPTSKERHDLSGPSPETAKLMPRFWQEINRLGAQDGDILTDGARRWRYNVQRCGCRASLEEIFTDGRDPEHSYLSARVPGTLSLET